MAWNADAGVGHADHGIGVRPHGLVAAAGAGDPHHPALGHGVAGVDGEVEQSQLELVGVGQGPGRFRIEVGGDAVLRADGAGQQVVHALNQAVDVHRLQRQPLRARKGQQLPRQLGGAVRGLVRVLRQARDFLVLGPALDELQVAIDDGEQVVEVVGDAAGELAHRLHLLRLHQGGLGPHTLGGLLHQLVVGLGELVGALGDAGLQRAVQLPQPLLGRGQFLQTAARLVLSPAAPQRRFDGARQGLAVDRPFQQHDVAQFFQHPRRVRRTPAGALGGQQHEREI